MSARLRVWRHWNTLLLLPFVLGLAVRAVANPLTVTPGVFANEEYDDNVHFQKTKVDDYITTVGLNLNLGYEAPSSTTTLSTGFAGSYFARNSVTNFDPASAQRVFLSNNYQYSSRLSFAINDGFHRLNNSARTLGFVNSPGTAVQDPGQVNPGGVNTFLPRGSALTNSFGLTASYLLTPLWTGSLSYTNGVSSFTNPDATDLTNRVGLTLAYQWNPQLSVNTSYDYSYFHASNAPDSDANTATVGASYTFAQFWSAFGSVGATVNRPVGSSNTSTTTSATSTTTSATFNVGIDRTFERSSLVAGAFQGLTPSAGVAGTSTTLGGYINYQIQLTQYLNGVLYTHYTNFDTSSGSFNTYQLGASLFYPLWRQITAGLIYSYRRSDSNQAIGNTLEAGAIDANIVSIHIGTTFQLWQLDV